MFRKHWPKFIPIFVILFVLLAGIVYRGIFYAPMNKNIIASFPHYSIKELDGQYYLRASQTDNSNWNSSFNAAASSNKQTFRFLSPEDMQKRILEGDLTREQIQYIYYCTSSVDREYDLYICDIVHVIKPVFDLEFGLTTVDWSVLSYAYKLRQDTSVLSFTVYSDKKDYEQFIEANYTKRMDIHKDNFKRTDTTSDGDATIHHYENISLKQIRSYRLPCKSGSITVVEQYYDDTKAPDTVHFYGTYNGIYFSGGCDDQFLATYGDQYQQILQSMKLTTVTYEAQP